MLGGGRRGKGREGGRKEVKDGEREEEKEEGEWGGKRGVGRRDCTPVEGAAPGRRL